jgi:hypothetical protein
MAGSAAHRGPLWCQRRDGCERYLVFIGKHAADPPEQPCGFPPARAATPSRRVAPAMRQLVWAVGRNVPQYEVQTVAGEMGAVLVPDRHSVDGR